VLVLLLCQPSNYRSIELLVSAVHQCNTLLCSVAQTLGPNNKLTLWTGHDVVMKEDREISSGLIRLSSELIGAATTYASVVVRREHGSHSVVAGGLIAVIAW
jgi:hypothetical protein